MPTSTTEDEFDLNTEVLAAFAVDGLLKEDGSGVDLAKVRARMVPLIQRAKVLSVADRRTKAITRGALVRELLPSLPDFDSLDGTERDRAEQVQVEADKKIWNETRFDSPLQVLLGAVMGDGYLMIRSRISLAGNRTSAVYVTGAFKLVEEDLITLEAQAVDAKAQQFSRVLQVVMAKHPGKSRRIIQAYERQVRASLDSGKARLQLTADAVGGSDDAADAADEG